ncbi:aldo-keto reductase [Sporothrix brasiliensis 5110]|uniref:Aldo-keto reductase n=1 Tax=Sporothrix brasiliensis 5110 TaxID=1398154 RepID=A0A0C2JE22_9PEZI|nr:aldo-keto reductase [Sporothrix brasiliensis 5110]KIH95177.1 aldo-keto reductase [Sporothrix brasiliensis 5110]
MSDVPLRQLGSNGPLVPSLGFGCMGLSSSYGPVDDDEARFKVLDKAHELGSRLWDTSDVYGDSEDLLGKWFKYSGKRCDIFLCTKFGVKVMDKVYSMHSDPEYVREACERSLRRLGVDKIDLYYCHRVDLKTPIERTMEALVRLKREGKIGHIGLSEVSVSTSPFSLDIELSDNSLLDTCRELGIAVVAYSPLGRGFLTGQLKSPDDFSNNDFRKSAPKYSKKNWSKNMELVYLLESIAKDKGCTPGQLALAWVLKQGDDIFAIPGTKKVKYLEENMASLKVTLTDAEAKTIRDQVEKIELQGERYVGVLEHYSFGETPPLGA